MIEIRKTEIFAKWLDGLNDIRARARVLARIERLTAGNPGDVAPVGEGFQNCGSTSEIMPKKRRPTKPSKAAKARRMEGKAKRSTVKSLRGKPVD